MSEVAMTRDELLVDLADYFHDWIDGDDPVKHSVVDHSEDPPGLQVMFQSGKIFWITAEDIT